MSDAYSRETLALKQEVESYVNADLYDPERPKIVAVSACAQTPGCCLLVARSVGGYLSPVLMFLGWLQVFTVDRQQTCLPGWKLLR